MPAISMQRVLSPTALIGLVFVVFSLVFAGAARADFNRIYVFGDSLSDNGNAFKDTGGSVPPAPYVGGRFSNGPVAVERLASLLNAPLSNFAYGGATTGIGNVIDNGTTAKLGSLGLPGIATEVDRFLAGNPGALNAAGLYVIWGGPNDFLTGLGDGSFANQAVAQQAIAAGVSNLVSSLLKLAAKGAVDFIVPLMADLGSTARAFSQGPQAQSGATAFTVAFNNALRSAINALNPNVRSHIRVFDTFTIGHQIYDNAARFGIANVTQPCFNATAKTLCGNPDQFFFFDDIHPTAKVHGLIGDQLALLVTPEPETWGMMALGLGMLLVWSRRTRRV